MNDEVMLSRLEERGQASLEGHAIDDMGVGIAWELHDGERIVSLAVEHYPELVPLHCLPQERRILSVTR